VNIYLIGFMGSGKSTVGRKLATELNWNFIDLDNIVEEQEGLPIPVIFKSHGESYFREAESRALKSVSNRSGLVVACGGGTPCSTENMAEIKESGIVVYLNMTVKALVSRLEKSKTIRPLLASKGKEDLETTVEKLFKERTPWYEQADIIAESLNADIEKIAMQLAARIKESEN